jgi:hypothetical protein
MPNLWYAVAVRDGNNLCLYRSIRRNHKAEAFVFFPPADKWPDEMQAESEKAGWSHATYHADGTVQVWNMLGDRVAKRTQQKLDASFRGTEPLLTSPVILSELHREVDSIGVHFADTFEISADKIAMPQADVSFQVGVDLVEPGCSQYQMGSGWTVIDQKAFKDVEPWVLVTLWAEAMKS